MIQVLFCNNGCKKLNKLLILLDVMGDCLDCITEGYEFSLFNRLLLVPYYTVALSLVFWDRLVLRCRVVRTCSYARNR